MLHNSARSILCHSTTSEDALQISSRPEENLQPAEEPYEKSLLIGIAKWTKKNPWLKNYSADTPSGEKRHSALLSYLLILAGTTRT